MASAIGTGFGATELWADFNIDNVTALNETVIDSATQDILNKHGGWWRMVLAGDDLDAVLLAGERSFEADEGFPLVYETAVQFSAATPVAGFFGFTDDPVESIAVIITDEDGGSFTTVASDAVGFLLDEQDLTWAAVGVQNDVDNNSGAVIALTAGADAVAATTQYLRLELNPNDSGTVHYFIDSELVSTQTSFFRSGILYCPCVSVDDRGTAVNVDIDFLYASAPRSLG